MKELLTTMMKGWIIHVESWVDDTEAPNGMGRYVKDEITAMAEACDGDRMKGELLYLFSYWGNDIQSVAAHYGVGIIDGKVVDIPPPPTPEHWWDTETHVWHEPEPDLVKEADHDRI